MGFVQKAEHQTKPEMGSRAGPNSVSPSLLTLQTLWWCPEAELRAQCQQQHWEGWGGLSSDTRLPTAALCGPEFAGWFLAGA